MKLKKLPVFLLILILFSLGSLSLFALSIAAEPPLWDQSISDGFAGGNGTEENPYTIATAEQLAFLAKSVNEGQTYEGEYIQLIDDIYLNDESFTFNPDTGLIKVTNGKHTAFLGTGIPGDNSGTIDLFDAVASACGIWYANDLTKAEGAYGGTLYTFTSIGNESRVFSGVFDGNQHTIHGVYINGNDNRTGLFGSCSSASAVRNLTVADSYIRGNTHVGGITGYGFAYDCRFTGIVQGNTIVGGVAGYSIDAITDCVGSGTVLGVSSVGGVAGYSGAGKQGISADGCRHEGAVIGCKYVGGITGQCIGEIRSCSGSGNVIGRFLTENDQDSNRYIGGIVGYVTIGGSVNACQNSGFVSGDAYVGGVIGHYPSNAEIWNCQNSGNVKGRYIIGGILGCIPDSSQCSINDCVNTGNITADPKEGMCAGGIAGFAYFNDIYDCANHGAVSAPKTAGGIVGCGSPVRCYNTGAVQGNEQVGGIAGGSFTQTTENGFSYLRTSMVKNCYNTGTVRGGEFVGGILGSGTAQYCYNIGAVYGNDNVGAILGDTTTLLYNDLRYCYYADPPIVSDGGNIIDPVTGVKRLTADKMKMQASYQGFSFPDVWEMKAEGISFPTLHTHTYDQQTTRYCLHEATCQTKGVYAYSCVCGKQGRETFIDGELAPHSQTKSKFTYNLHSHYRICSVCDEIYDRGYHDWSMKDLVLSTAKTIFACRTCQYQTVTDIPEDILSQILSADLQSKPEEPEEPEEPDSDSADESTQTLPTVTLPSTSDSNTFSYHPILFILIGAVVGALGFYTYIIIKESVTRYRR